MRMISRLTTTAVMCASVFALAACEPQDDPDVEEALKSVNVIDETNLNELMLTVGDPNEAVLSRLAGTLGIEVIHTPGHTAGHCAYLWPDHGGVLFVGDAVANWFGRLGPAPLAEDWNEARASARKLAEREFATVVFGHGPVLKDGAAARLRAFVEDWA